MSLYSYRIIDEFIYWFDVSPPKPGSFFRTIFHSAAFAVTKKINEKKKLQKIGN